MLLSLIPASAPAKRSPAPTAAAAGPQPVVGGLRVEPVRAAGGERWQVLRCGACWARRSMYLSRERCDAGHRVTSWF